MAKKRVRRMTSDDEHINQELQVDECTECTLYSLFRKRFSALSKSQRSLRPFDLVPFLTTNHVLGVSRRSNHNAFLLPHVVKAIPSIPTGLPDCAIYRQVSYFLKLLAILDYFLNDKFLLSETF